MSQWTHKHVNGLICTVETFNSCSRQPCVCQCLVVQTPMDNMSKDKPGTPTSHVACESKLHSVVMSSKHPCPGNWVVFGCAVVYYALAVHAFSTGIECRHCSFSRASISTINPSSQPLHNITRNSIRIFHHQQE